MDKELVSSRRAGTGGCQVGQYKLIPGGSLCTSCTHICPQQGTSDWRECRVKCPEVYNEAFSKVSSTRTSAPFTTEPTTADIQDVGLVEMTSRMDDFLRHHVGYIVVVTLLIAVLVILYKTSDQVRGFVHDKAGFIWRYCNGPSREHIPSTSSDKESQLSSLIETNPNDEDQRHVDVHQGDVSNRCLNTLNHNSTRTDSMMDGPNNSAAPHQASVESLNHPPVQEDWTNYATNRQYIRQHSNPETSVRRVVHDHRPYDDNSIRGYNARGNSPVEGIINNSYRTLSQIHQPSSGNQHMFGSQRYGVPENPNAASKVVAGTASFDVLPQHYYL